MQFLRFSLIFLFIFGLTHVFAAAQLFEDFEQGTKGDYTVGNVSLETGMWRLTEALLGTDNRDRKNGNKSVRMRSNGSVAMLFTKNGGAGYLTFYQANSGFVNDTGGKLQVEYSIDNGSTWIKAGDEIVCENQFEETYLYIGVPDDIRFRFRHISGNRINMDDVYIAPYIEPADDAFIVMRIGNETIAPDAEFTFPPTLIGTTFEQIFTIYNHGLQDLVITDAMISGEGFAISELEDDIVEPGDRTNVKVSYSPDQDRQYSGELTIESNSIENDQYTITLSGIPLVEGEIIPIAEARELSFGTRVTVTGWVTVANEFDGPVFFQDETAGLAAFYRPLHSAVEIGDSIVITGPITEFNPIGGTPGTFLRQIASHGDDDDIQFEVYTEGRSIQQPKQLTIAGMNGGGFEGQLVQIDDVVIHHSGAFQGNANYTISDPTGSGELRIDNSTNLVGVLAPEEAITIVGVVDRFNAVYQLKPRFTDDVGLEDVERPGDDVTKDLTFDVTTWNIEWFGSVSNGPDDVELQISNVKTIVDSINADLFAFQEISNNELFYQMVAQLDEYNGFVADYDQQQRVAYLYKTTIIDSLEAGLLTSGQSSFDWAGRLPLLFRFEATVSGVTKEIIAINVHAKAFDDFASYQRRLNASEQLKLYLDQNHPHDKVIFLGDYNDDVIESITQGQDSPYNNFDIDQNYMILTRRLSERGFTSYRYISMIDHITVSSELFDYYFEETERVENPYYIGSYLSTTSDHFPVSVRFLFDPNVSVNNNEYETPQNFSLHQNYPNPFNNQTTIRYSLPYDGYVSLRIFNLLGQEVMSLIDERQTAGIYNVTFDASGLPSGLYFYRLHAAGRSDRNGTSQETVDTRRMILMK